jgi:ParB family transcriptional regulator, chromosome partitioning protein
MKKPITVSGLVQTGVIQNNLETTLPKFKGQSDFSNEIAIHIALEQIQPNLYQPRSIFPDIELQELAASIAEIGLIQPIAVRKLGETSYQIIAGERRFRAFKLLNKSEIPCVLFSCTDADMAVMAIAENVSRQDLSDYEIAKSIRNVESLFPSKTSLAESLGFQREDMYRYFAYNALPDFVIEKLETNPRLLSRNAAADIKRVFNKITPEHYNFALSVLKEAIALLETAEIDQTKIAHFIAMKVKHFSNGENLDVNNKKEELFIEDKKIGYFSSSTKGVEVKISAGVLSYEKIDELKKILTDFLNSSINTIHSQS